MDQLPDDNALGGGPTIREARLQYDPFAARAFLASHRATLVCAREVALLLKTVAAGASALNAGGSVERPAVRRSPDRCIVQLGPVAITVAWLPRRQVSIEDGRLLVILWRGMVAPPTIQYEPERVPTRAVRSSATALGEQTYRPVAASEATWNWKPEGQDHSYASADLGERCVEWLRTAYAAGAGDRLQ
jgi:hypothetical protein